MSGEIVEQVAVKPKKKSLLKHRWFWLPVVLVVIVIAALSSGCGSTVYELSLATKMAKQDIVDKFGKPDEVARDDSDGYMYSYGAGFDISGNDKGALEISLQSDAVKKKTSDSYKIMDVTLGSSFDENVKRLGEPDLSISQGNKIAMYLTEEDFVMSFATEKDSDDIAVIRLAYYTDSTDASTLDLCSALGTIATEDELKKVYKINDKSTETSGSAYLYSLKGFDLRVGKENDIAYQSVLEERNIFNIAGIRPEDTFERAKKLFGEPVDSIEGFEGTNTTYYIFNYDDSLGLAAIKTISVAVDNSTNKIGQIIVTLPALSPDDTLIEDETASETEAIATKPQESETTAESAVTESQGEEPTAVNANAEWNTEEIDALQNGNIPLAVDLLETSGDIKEDAVSYSIDTLFQDLPQHIGQVVKITGILQNPEDWELNSDLSDVQWSTVTTGILITTEDGIPVYMFCKGITNLDSSLNFGDKVAFYGYLVGHNIIGPYESYDGLILVGNAGDITPD